MVLMSRPAVKSLFLLEFRSSLRDGPRNYGMQPFQLAIYVSEAWCCRFLAIGFYAAFCLVSLGCHERPPPSDVRIDRSSLSRSPDEISVPGAVRTSPFLNTNSTVQYVGTQACASCHGAEFHSYSQTSHSRALQLVDAKEEPPGCHFVQARSGRTYEVFQSQDRIWHQESVEIQRNDREVLARYPMTYLIGSGNHSRSYLAEVNGFLVESPLTWYRSKMAWGMSPGYDRPQHPGFERTADFGCLHCHAGRLDMVNGNRFRVQIQEMSIGCENCHGPGSLHIAHQELRPPDDGADLTIVNPARLSRDDAEAICAQCHLRGHATALVSGRTLNDFRPGLRITDFRVDFLFEEPDKSMKVVGHVEQMRMSRCYRESAEMTCTTCHDPHQPPSVETRVEYYRQRCLKCHDSGACRLGRKVRLEQNAMDDCAACHMPKGETDIIHLAFTHHRIGIHPKENRVERSSDEKWGRLLPASEISHLPELERQRLLGLAYLEWSDKQGVPAARLHYQREARQLLAEVHDSNPGQTEVAASLARIDWERGDYEQAQQFALSSLRGPDTSVNALFVAGDIYLRQGDKASALRMFKQLVAQRRLSEDWLLLGICQVDSGDISAAIASLEQAATIDPVRVDVVELLIQICDRADRSELSRKYRRRLQALRDVQLKMAP